MHVIGTAGHIDHGKSTLIQALTGIDPDRLKEEKERGMTIDLGFAWITLPSGVEAGIVDVPGHHRFVRNMLAGVGGIDMVLFVVAATESWMPQSQEHLDIINLLGISRGIIVLTKADLVEADWLEMVTEEVREKLAGSSLSEAEIVPVSSTTGHNLDLLREKVDAILSVTATAADKSRPRLWIDRVFTIRGSGTVVTGTLEGGTLKCEQPGLVLPAGLPTRVRGLQTHRKPAESVAPGTRVAVNLTGLETDSLQRGDALVAPGQWVASDLVNAQIHTLASLGYELPQECELKLYVGTAELLAQVRLLHRQTLPPGETGLAQIRLERPAVIDFHDRFILRDATRQDTVGGGIVLDAHAQRVRGRDLRLPRSAPGAYKVLTDGKAPVRHLDLTLLNSRVTATPPDLPLIILAERGWASIDELQAETPLVVSALKTALTEHGAAGRLVLLPSYAVAPITWVSLIERLRAKLSEYHQNYPLRSGLDRETLRSGIGMEPRLFEESTSRFIADGTLAGSGALLHLPDFAPTFTPQQELEVKRITDLLSADMFSPPELDDLISSHGCNMDVINALVEQGRLVKLGKGIVYLESAVAQARERIAATISGNGDIDIGAVRDALGTTRKYAIPLMEYLDQTGFTRRIGDKRVLA